MTDTEKNIKCAELLGWSCGALGDWFSRNGTEYIQQKSIDFTTDIAQAKLLQDEILKDENVNKIIIYILGVALDSGTECHIVKFDNPRRIIGYADTESLAIVDAFLKWRNEL